MGEEKIKQLGKKKFKKYNDYNFLELLKILIEKVFSPLFNQEEIPEILFNPINSKFGDDRITEFFGKFPDEESKEATLNVLKHVSELPIHKKIMMFLGLFSENFSMHPERFEAKKVQIFGDEIKGLSLSNFI